MLLLLINSFACIAATSETATAETDSSAQRLRIMDDAMMRFQGMVSQPGFARIASRNLLPLADHVCTISKVLLHGAALSALMRAGEFKDAASACRALASFHPVEWEKIPMIDLDAMTNPRGNDLAKSLIKEYIDLNRNQCGFSKLPVGIQLKYSDYFRPDPRFVLETITLPNGSVQHRFTLSPPNFSSATYSFESLTDTFGIFRDLQGSAWIFDMHKNCVAYMIRTDLQLLPQLKVAAEITWDDKVKIFWPSETLEFPTFLPFDEDDGEPVSRRLEIFASPRNDRFYVVETSDLNDALVTADLETARLTRISDNVSVIQIDGDFARVSGEGRTLTLALRTEPKPGNPKPFKFSAGLSEDLCIIDLSWSEVRQFIQDTCLELRAQLARADSSTDPLRDICRKVSVGGVQVEQLKSFTDKYLHGKSPSLWNIRDVFLFRMYGHAVKIVFLDEFLSRS